jgi:hypothetical protein
LPQKRRPPACGPDCRGCEPHNSAGHEHQDERAQQGWHLLADADGVELQNGLRTLHEPTPARHPSSADQRTTTTCETNARLVEGPMVSGKQVLMELEGCSTGQRQVYAFQLGPVGEVRPHHLQLAPARVLTDRRSMKECVTCTD